MAASSGGNAAFSGNFGAGSGKQFNIGNVSGEAVYMGTGDNQRLSDLPYVEHACFNSREREKEPSCLDGTRIDLLNEIAAWADTTHSDQIFWLSGRAGTDKSTIARTIARRFHENNRLVASFFFLRGGSNAGGANSFATTIARQLADFDPILKQGIQGTLEEHPLITRQGIVAQWKELVLKPLRTFKPRSDYRASLLVVDALDECQGEDDFELIVRLLADIPQVCEHQVLIFVTSRPESFICPNFSSIRHRELRLQSFDQEVIDHDILQYLVHEFKIIADRYWNRNEWPGEESLMGLKESAAGLFIWVATACRYVREGRSKKFVASRLERLLQNQMSGNGREGKLDEMYNTILRLSIRDEWTQGEQEEHCAYLQRILGSIIILQSPLSATALGHLLHQGDVESSLGDLHSVLDIPDSPMHPIRLHHPSFRDFLFSNERCSDVRFLVHKEQQHLELADSCIDLMCASLKHDTHGLRDPGVLKQDIAPDWVNEGISEELEYACQYWVQHLQCGKAILLAGCKAHLFLEQHLLHWIETLSWTNKTFDCVRMITDLLPMVGDQNSPLADLLHDAHRFTLNFFPITNTAPLQLSCSSLLSSPSQSVVGTLFEREIPSWIVVKP